MWTTLLLSQSSYGAVVRKSALRIVGALLGGFLALATILLIMTNTNDMVAYLLAIFVVAALADYGGRSSPHIAYGLLQMGITYLICVAVLGPTSDVDVVLERLFSREGGEEMESNVSAVKVKEAKARSVNSTLNKLKALQQGGTKDGE